MKTKIVGQIDFYELSGRWYYKATNEILSGGPFKTELDALTHAFGAAQNEDNQIATFSVVFGKK